MGTPFSRNNSGGGDLSCTFVPFVVRVAKCTAASDPTQDPTYGSFEVNNDLRVETIHFGSTLGGMSHATLSVVPGAPQTPGTRIENITAPNMGDRVIISIGDEPRFGGYCIGAELMIADAREAIGIRLVGPEWLWGEDSASGCRNPIVGQARRTAAGDDAYADDGTATTNDKLDVLMDENAVFNPSGRKNMTNANVEVSNGSDGGPTIQGRVFETADRLKAGEDLSAAWTAADAVKFLVGWYNAPNDSGIDMPDFDAAALDADTTLREISVQGMGLWGALKKVLEPDWHFYVDPVPSSASSWEGFKLKFFQRGVGDDANFTLNAPGTSATAADWSVNRIQADKDTAKTVNSVHVLGKAIRHIQLNYYGSDTPSKSADDAKLMLQHGWGKTEGDLQDFEGDADSTDGSASGAATSKEVTPVTIHSKDVTTSQRWIDRHMNSGKEFTQYNHVFRLFIWNEAGEWTPDDDDKGQPTYGAGTAGSAGETDFDWVTPKLDGIADDTGFIDEGDTVGPYFRRKRPLLDTAFLASTSDVDGWTRTPPTLYMRAYGTASTTNVTPWVRVNSGCYRVDHQRAAVWITVPDIANWRPLEHVHDADEATVNDYRTFATLLYTGKLRMMLEASIATDGALDQVADRQASAGNPHVREAYANGSRSYVKSINMTGSVDSPSGIDLTLMDNADDAMTLAESLRRSGERQAVHASVLAEADWPEQPLGSIVAETAGRDLNFRSGGGNSGPGAQIVSKVIDVATLKWEYGTESRAQQLHSHGRRKVQKAAHYEKSHAERAGGTVNDTGANSGLTAFTDPSTRMA